MSEDAFAQENVGSPEQQIEHRYLAAMDALYEDAMEQDCDYVLTDVLAWTLARLLTRSDMSFVAGDVLQDLGRYMRKLAEPICAGCARVEVEAERAEAEAEWAPKVGRQPQ